MIDIEQLVAPPIHTLARTVARDFEDRDKGLVLIKAGQRSGKTTACCAIAALMGVDSMTWVSEQEVPSAISEPFGIKSSFSHIGKQMVNRGIIPGVPIGSLIVVEEIFWVSDSYRIVLELAKNYRVIAIGSRGPEYDNDTRWKFSPCYSFATWDLNPSVTFASLLHEFDKDPERATRDFCAF